MIFQTTTPKGTEGHGISFSDELHCSETLKGVLPKDWKVLFSWSQILFTDVQYNIDKKNKTIDITYNQNLRYWWKQLHQELKEKLTTMEVLDASRQERAIRKFATK